MPRESNLPKASCTGILMLLPKLFNSRGAQSGKTQSHCMGHRICYDKDQLIGPMGPWFVRISTRQRWPCYYLPDKDLLHCQTPKGTYVAHKRLRFQVFSNILFEDSDKETNTILVPISSFTIKDGIRISQYQQEVWPIAATTIKQTSFTPYLQALSSKPPLWSGFYQGMPTPHALGFQIYVMSSLCLMAGPKINTAPMGGFSALRTALDWRTDMAQFMDIILTHTGLKDTEQRQGCYSYSIYCNTASVQYWMLLRQEVSNFSAKMKGS
jgi:hypothetical protein